MRKCDNGRFKISLERSILNKISRLTTTLEWAYSKTIFSELQIVEILTLSEEITLRFRLASYSYRNGPLSIIEIFSLRTRH